MLALGAKAIQVGRAPLWGLGAFDSRESSEVVDARGGMKLDMALAGVLNLAAINRKMARRT